MSDNILQPFNIRVSHKPITTLRQLPTNIKDEDEPKNRQEAVYEISYSNCQAPFIGETGRNKKSKEFVFEDITWTGRPLISSASRSNPGASSWDLYRISKRV